jgi:hypothetical protein
MYMNPEDLGLFLLGKYEPETTKRSIECLKDGDVVVDIWFSRGQRVASLVSAIEFAK